MLIPVWMNSCSACRDGHVAGMQLQTHHFDVYKLVPKCWVASQLLTTAISCMNTVFHDA
jgi:hypothetical protein